jgi:hypothetical protein
MATELQRPPKFQLVRDEASGVVAADDGALNDTTHPVASSFRAGGADKIVLYWDANKDGSNLAAAGDTVTVEVLIRNGVEDAWVIGARVVNLEWRTPAVVPVFQCPRIVIRKVGVAITAPAKGFQVWAAKQHGPLADI